MTTWTADKANETGTEHLGKTVQKTYSVAGVAGDTGGTLTCTGLKILDDCTANVYAAAGGVATFSRISGNTVIVTHNNPGDAHTVKVTVWGVKG